MALEVGSDAPGSRLECGQCLVSLKVFEDDCGVMQLNVVGRPLMEVTAPCDSCGAEVSHQERFCVRCGSEVTAAAAADLRQQTVAQQREEAATVARRGRERAFHQGSVRSGSKVLLWLAVLFAVSGTIRGWLARGIADKAQDQLRAYAPEESVQLSSGEFYVVRDLRNEIEREVTMTYAVNYFLAVLMVGIFVWSRRAALPALITGLGVYLAVQVLNVAMDPKSLHSGILWKIIFISAFVSGIKAAMEQRASRLEEEDDSWRGTDRA